MATNDLKKLATQYKEGSLNGHDLANLVTEGKISKGDRRVIVKLATKMIDEEHRTLSPRQQLRLEVKEKKKQPRVRMSYEERKEKYGKLDELEKERYKESSNFVICLGCRKRGHFLKDCPKRMSAVDSNEGAAPDEEAKIICFNCGAKDHALRNCPSPMSKDGLLPFANCFICKEMGHLSKNCPNNAHGLYPKGGCCHICLQKDHLVKDCPQRTEEDIEREKRKREEKLLGPKVTGLTWEEGGDKGGDYDDFELSAPADSDIAGGDDDDEGKEKSSKRPKKKHKKEKKEKKERK